MLQKVNNMTLIVERNMNKAKQIINSVKKQGRIVMTEIESKQVCQAAGINTVDTRLASSQKDALAISADIGFPVVLKIASPDITHKSDAGGVKVGLRNKTDVRKAYGEIMASAGQKYPEANIEGTEIIIGMFKDPQFGPVIMFGLGGIFVEVLKDVSFRIIPIVRRDAAEMIKEIRGYPLLQGYRGQECANIASLEDILMKVSDFIDKTPEIRELDLNPIFAYKDGAVAVDARMVLEDNASG